MTTTLENLSAEDKKALQKQWQAEAKEAKRKKEEDKKSLKELSGDFVQRNIDPFVHHHEITESLIEKLFNDYKPLQELKSSIYGNKINEQESHTSTLEDGSASLTVGYNVTIGFDGTEAEGVKKIKEFLSSLSNDNDDDKKVKLTKIANTFLKPNAKSGMLNPVKIIELSKLKEDFNDERFNEGLQIIFDAQQKRQNSMYVSGWKFVPIGGVPKKLEFRFTV